MKSLTLWAIFLLTTGLGLAQSGNTSLFIEKDSINQLTLEIANTGVYQMVTTGKGPYFYTEPLKSSLPSEQQVLSFEYFCPMGLDHLQIWFEPPAPWAHSKLIRRVGMF